MGCKGISQRGAEATSWLSSLLCDIQSCVYYLCSLVILLEVDIVNFAKAYLKDLRSSGIGAERSSKQDSRT